MTKKHSKSKEHEATAEKEITQKTDVDEVENSVENPEEETSSAEDSYQKAITEIEIKVKQLEKDLVDAKDKHLRLIAEYDNYRKRTLKEKIELSKIAGEKIITEILPVIDDFERAILHLDNASDLDAVKDGISLIYNKFISFLSKQGVKEIETKNQDFNADLHEAITKVAAPSDELKGKILDCVQKGYFLDDKVIRYPHVVVGE